MLGFGRVSVWFWAGIGQDNVLTFLFFFCYDKYMKNLGGHNSYEKRSHLRKERFFQRRFAPHSNRSLQKIRRRQRLYRRPYLCRQQCIRHVGKTPALQRLLKDINSSWETVIILDHSRFFKEPRKYIEYMLKLNFAGKRIIIAIEQKEAFAVKVAF